MKHARIAALLLVLVPLQARALDTTELLGIVAMPLAVAAAAEVTGVPADDLSRLVATLNRAEVAPTQVVQVVRYAPVALVVEQPQQPAFIDYVDTQVSQGVTGTRLVTVIDERLRTYDVSPQFVALQEPATTFVLREDYIATTSIRQPVVSDSNDLLSLIALPLAVSAASEVTGVPVSELANLVAVLNSGGVPPQQIIEVVRYAPVAFVEEPQFVTFLRTQVDEGLRGPQLIEVVDQRLRTFDVAPQFAGSNVVVVDDGFIPTVVRTRVAESRSHPHGGPPGQLKKQRGLQTGAEVVHRDKPRRVEKKRDAPVRVVERRNEPRVVNMPPGHAKKADGGHGQGKGNDKGKGKGKGKG
jgi:hypothetical protein